MASAYQAGDVVVHMVPPSLGAAPAPDTQVMGASEKRFVFHGRVTEMATLAAAMRRCRNGTAFTAMQTRVNAIDD